MDGPDIGRKMFCGAAFPKEASSERSEEFRKRRRGGIGVEWR